RQVVARRDETRAARRHFGPESPLAGQPAAGEGTPRDDGHTVPLTRREYVGFDASDKQRIRRLLAHEAFASAFFRDPLRFHDLRRREGGRTEVSHLALMDKVGQSRKRLVDVALGLWTVDLIEVD